MVYPGVRNAAGPAGRYTVSYKKPDLFNLLLILTLGVLALWLLT